MFNKTIVATALLGLGLASTAQAADPTANVVFRGLVGNSVPGANLIITGNNGAEQIDDGALLVNQDGTFQTTDSVIVEAHTYTPESTDGTTPALIGDIDDTAVWRVTGITTIYGANTSADDATTVTDEGRNAVDLSALNADTDPTGTMTLSVANDQPITDLEDYNAVTVSVGITAHIDS